MAASSMTAIWREYPAVSTLAMFSLATLMAVWKVRSPLRLVAIMEEREAMTHTPYKKPALP
jgi:hypothetical protein